MVGCYYFGLDRTVGDGRLFLALGSERKEAVGAVESQETPDVLLMVALSPAKSASENNPRETSSGVSPTKPICRHCVVPRMYLMIRNSLRSQGVSQFVITVESTLNKSGRAHHAMFIIFIKTLQAILLSAPVQAATVSAGAEDLPALLLGGSQLEPKTSPFL